jgi:hypothetical protein
MFVDKFYDLDKSFLLGKILLVNDLDDTDSHGLFHVSDGESAEGWVFGEHFHAHGLLGDQLDHGGITTLDEFGFLLNDFASSSVVLGLDFGKFAGNVGGVAIQHWGVTVGDLSRVVDNDDLGDEEVSFTSGVVL